MKRELPQFLAFVTGLLLVLAFFVPTEFFSDMQERLTNYQSIVLAFSYYLALASLVSIHGEKISRRDEGYGFSVVLLVALFITTGWGIFYGVEAYYNDHIVMADAAARPRLLDLAREYKEARTLEERVAVVRRAREGAGSALGALREATMAKILSSLTEKSFSGETGRPLVVKVQYYNPFQWIFDFVYQPLQATMFSILAFYVATAAYRAFRARTAEGTLLLLAAFLVMIGRVPIGQWISTQLGFVSFPEIQEWLMSVPTKAGQRAVLIGASLGVVSASLRMLLGLEQTYLGTE